MNDVEELITAHLERTAAHAEPRPDLERVLRSAQAGTTVSLTAHPRRRGWMRPTLAVAAAVVAVALVSVSLARGGSSERAPVTMRPPDPSRAASGFAVVSGDRVTVYGADGTEIGEAVVPADTDPATLGRFEVRQDGGELALTPVDDSMYARLGLPAGEDCAELDATREATVETCRTSADEGFGRELVHVTRDDTRRTLATVDDVTNGGTTPAAGHWARADLSPDGEWLAAEMTGECEVPTVVLIRIADGAVLGPDGSPLADSADQAPEPSRLLGWGDGGALIATFQGECGAADHPGVRAVQPTTGAVDQLVPLAGTDGLTTDQVVPWRRQR